MDRLVRSGVSFTSAHIPCGTSGAVCMPSRAMLHSARTLFRIDGAGERIPREHVTLGQAFREAGYATFGTGKWHNGRESFNRSFATGDEIFFGGMADHWNVPFYRFDPSGAYDAALPVVERPFESNAVTLRQCDHVQAGRHSTEMISDATLRFLETRLPGEPFLAYVSYLAPHDPRTMPARFREMYDPERIRLPPNYLGGHPFDNGATRIRDELLAGFPRRPEEIRRHVADYYGMISHLDHELGRALDSLERRGLLEETIVVLAGDNGLALGQHGLMGKQSCYEHSVRVPLVFSGPAVPRDVRVDAPVYLLDVFPTLCELAGIGIPASVEGRSLAPLMADPTAAPRESLYFAYCEFQRAVKKGGRKLVEYVVGGRRTETQLFDLESDPWELRNLADDQAHAADLVELRRELVRLRDEWGDLDSVWGRTFWSGYSTPAAPLDSTGGSP
jgi:arylsulfatase A-like enzyme